MTLATIPGPATGEELREWLARGSIHRHPGDAPRWRWSPHGGATVYLDNAPESYLGCGLMVGARLAYASPELGIYGRTYADGTASLSLWDGPAFRLGAAMYGARDDAEKRLRDWLMETLP